ncbi:MAG TPA: peptidoglycan DD-metalloendopeptidase family protein [Bryobacteraceae bacterium]|nr:peptidoglycan DD-metalloendopeptidase family protein [Bryobacteraceae bacterium]
MNQPYFVLVLAHSVHGRLRRLHLSHTILYTVLALAVVGGFTVVGFLTSYARMAWKVANYNHLRAEVSTLQQKYQALARTNEQTKEQLATLQLLASEVTSAYGIKERLEGPSSIASESRLVPTYQQTLDRFDLLRTTRLYSSGTRRINRTWQTNVVPSLWPVAGRLLSSFGSRTDPFTGGSAFHSGVDISASTGTPVRCTADGIVKLAEWSGAYGKLVVIDHGGGVESYYAHLSSFDVIPGQDVRRSQVVGKSGSTGRASAPHLHYEVRQGGAPVNPYKYLARSLVFDGAPVQKDLPF